MCPALDVQTSAIRDGLILDRIMKIWLWERGIPSEFNILNKRGKIDCWSFPADLTDWTPRVLLFHRTSTFSGWRVNC